MPVFFAGESYARSIAAALDIPLFTFSHQEGHIEAVKAFSKHSDGQEILACHFSGGTSELLHVIDNGHGYDIEIVGGSKDIAFGQVIDRAGVAMGMRFPAGEEMDKLALDSKEISNILTPVKVKEGWLNLSGIDTQMKRALEDSNTGSLSMLTTELFTKLSDAMCAMISDAVRQTGINNVIMAGGVSSSRFMRERITEKLTSSETDVEFSSGELSQDNAIGVAVLGGKQIWE